MGTVLSMTDHQDRVLTVLPEPRLLIIVTKGRIRNDGDLPHIRSLKHASSVTFHSEDARVLTHHLLYTFNSLPSDTSGWRVSDQTPLVPSGGGGAAFVCCVGRGHPLLARIAEDATLSPMAYDDVDIDKLRVLVPLVTVHDTDWHGLLSGGKSFHRPLVLSLLGIHPLVYGQEKEEDTDAYTQVLRTLPESTMPLNNIHARYLRMMGVTLEHMREYNNHEHFSAEQPPVRIALEDGSKERLFFTPLPMAPDGVLQTHLRTSVVQGVRLSVGDRVTLPGLKGDAYVVVKVDQGGCTLVSHVHLKDTEVTFRDGKWARLQHVTDEQLRVGDNVHWGTGAGKVSRISYGTITVSVSEVDDTHGECITHPWLRTRHECEADMAMGKPKAVGVWDSPCTKDVQCPFYQKNKKYRNYRGGCIAGFCELPIGLQRVGYRQYREDKEDSFPYCRGCPGEPGRADCCAMQPEPDYAFVMDELERPTSAGA